MFEAETLRVIAAAMRGGFHLPYGDEIAEQLGLSWDRWFVSRYAGNPGIAAQAMGEYLERLAQRLADDRIQILLAELARVDEALAEQGEQLGAAVAGEVVLLGKHVKDVAGGVDVV